MRLANERTLRSIPAIEDPHPSEGKEARRLGTLAHFVNAGVRVVDPFID
jgi:hypothetical protein